MNPSVAQIRIEYLLPVVVPPALFFFTQLAFNLHRKDQFIARLFAEHRDIWDALGGPRGWQWSPPHGTPAPANPPSINFDWFSAAEPSWLVGAPELRTNYHTVRAGVRRWNFVAIPVFSGTAILFALLVRITQ